MAAISKQTNKHYFKLMILWFSCKKINKVLVFQSESDTAKKKSSGKAKKKKRLSRGGSVGR